MQRFICRSLAAISILVLWQTSQLSGRPRYGGNLRVEIRESIRSLDPAEWPADRVEFAAKERFVSLLFETLVRLDEDGRPQPLLALSWQQDAQNRRWRFRLRPDVKFHDGSLMNLEIVAAALSASAADWKASAAGDVLQIDSETPIPDLLFDLAHPSRSIFLRGADQKIYGTGPFRLNGWEPGQRAIVTANEQHWGGRPFLDAVTIEMGKSFSEQLMDLELGKADFVEIWPNEMRRIPKGTKTWTSSPCVLIALAFERGRPASEDGRLREALALSIDRPAIHNWLMQKQGETAAALLPQRLSGYAFLFSAKTDVKKARQLVSKPGQTGPVLSMAYDAFDPLARTMAERIAVNAREAGITLNPSSRTGNSDVRLVRLPIRTPSPETALADMIKFFRLTDAGHLPENATVEDLHSAENAILATNRIVPLFHVPEIFGSSQRLKTWMSRGIGPFGDWHFDDMWLDAERP